MIAENVPFYGFCSRSQKLKKEGLLSKPVLDHEELSENKEDYYFIVPSAEHYDRAVQRLKNHNIKKERILPYFRGDYSRGKSIYFEFPEYFRKGAAFVEAGSYNGADTIAFSKWCNGEYSKIYAFEPDPANAETCSESFSRCGISRIELFQAGLGERNGTFSFDAGQGQTSSIIEGNTEISGAASCLINVVSLDSVVKDTTVGFIKMDIEGAEYGALLGAQNTIVRDKPLLAVSAYHKPGGQLMLMEYLHSLVPEYKFWLRHYTSTDADTVLYAAVP